MFSVQRRVFTLHHYFRELSNTVSTLTLLRLFLNSSYKDDLFLQSLSLRAASDILSITCNVQIYPALENEIPHAGPRRRRAWQERRRWYRSSSVRVSETPQVPRSLVTEWSTALSLSAVDARLRGAPRSPAYPDSRPLGRLPGAATTCSQRNEPAPQRGGPFTLEPAA